MARRVKFGPSAKPRKAVATSFNFGFNTLTPKQHRNHRKRSGGKGGGRDPHRTPGHLRRDPPQRAAPAAAGAPEGKGARPLPP